GDVSTVGMVASGLMNAFKVGVYAAPSVTAVAAPLMGGSAIRSFRQAKTWEARMDAASSFSWSLQGGAEFLKNGVAFGAAAGVAGGALEATAGAYRLWTGLHGKKKSRARVIQGAIEVVAGVSWVAYSLNIAFPTNLAIFSAATAARLGYLGYRRHQEAKKEKKAPPSTKHAVPVAFLWRAPPRAA
ncbi:MAG: hypothetical protein JRH20_22875, partial [Deltaproteobacteria bacterium]|nr:hypothetical protein [Deltaproteobacteria bacterium]